MDSNPNANSYLLAYEFNMRMKYMTEFEDLIIKQL